MDEHANPGAETPSRPDKTCKVCNIDLTECKWYYKRNCICEEHAKSSLCVVDGQHVRWCQLCCKFQKLSDFDGNRRTCRKRLRLHNSRRRKRRSELRNSPSPPGSDAEAQKYGAHQDTKRRANGGGAGLGTDSRSIILHETQYQQQQQQQQRQVAEPDTQRPELSIHHSFETGGFTLTNQFSAPAAFPSLPIEAYHRLQPRQQAAFYNNGAPLSGHETNVEYDDRGVDGFRPAANNDHIVAASKPIDSSNTFTMAAIELQSLERLLNLATARHQLQQQEHPTDIHNDTMHQPNYFNSLYNNPMNNNNDAAGHRNLPLPRAPERGNNHTVDNNMTAIVPGVGHTATNKSNGASASTAVRGEQHSHAAPPPSVPDSPLGPMTDAELMALLDVLIE